MNAKIVGKIIIISSIAGGSYLWGSYNERHIIQNYIKTQECVVKPQVLDDRFWKVINRLLKFHNRVTDNFFVCFSSNQDQVYPYLELYQLQFLIKPLPI